MHAGTFVPSQHLKSHPLLSDHIDGLTRKWTHGTIYCSALTKALLIRKLHVESQLIVRHHLKNDALAHDRALNRSHCPWGLQLRSTWMQTSMYERFLIAFMHCLIDSALPTRLIVLASPAALSFVGPCSCDAFRRQPLPRRSHVLIRGLLWTHSLHGRLQVCLQKCSYKTKHSLFN